LVVSLEQYSQITLVKPFNVTLGSTELSCTQQPTEKYAIGSPPISFGVLFQNYTFVPVVKLTSFQELVAKDGADSDIAMPSFINYNRESNSFVAQTSKFEDVGTYKIGLKMGYYEVYRSEKVCLTTLIVEYKPTFQGDPI